MNNVNNPTALPEKISWIEAQVCIFIANNKNCSYLDAFRKFSASKTHKMLVDEKLEMWFFSPEAIYEIYTEEEKSGDPLKSQYLMGA